VSPPDEELSGETEINRDNALRECCRSALRWCWTSHGYHLQQRTYVGGFRGTTLEDATRTGATRPDRGLASREATESGAGHCLKRTSLLSSRLWCCGIWATPWRCAGHYELSGGYGCRGRRRKSTRRRAEAAVLCAGSMGADGRRRLQVTGESRSRACAVFPTTWQAKGLIEGGERSFCAVVTLPGHARNIKGRDPGAIQTCIQRNRDASSRFLVFP